MEAEVATPLDALERGKAVRLVEYLTRLAWLRAKITRDWSEYKEVLWLHELPEEKGCFTQAWGQNEEYDRDVWMEVQKRPEPELPAVPEVCKEWVNWSTIRRTNELPELLPTITRQAKNPAWKEGSLLPEFVQSTEKIEEKAHVREAWNRYIDRHWRLWAEEHARWEKVHRVYTALFAVHQEQLRLGEEYELVVGLGLLTWQTPSDQPVQRHVIVANATLGFESRLGRFTVRPSNDGAALRVELDMLDVEEQPARAEEAAKMKLENAGEDPWDRGCVDGVLSGIVHSLSPDGEYHEDLLPKVSRRSRKPVIERAPALILRKRSVKGLTEVLKRIKERIEAGESIPAEFRDLAEIGEGGGNGTFKEEHRGSDFGGEVYFPKPSNREQRRIIEVVRKSTGVLVQGPPGTGKSHTIANLICHMLATGARILITAKTPRALQVLEGLLPDELRPLCINLLGSGLEEKRSLEASVSTILRRNEEWNAARAKGEVQELEKKVRTFREEKASTENMLRSIRQSEAERQTIVNGTYEGTAAAIAQKVEEEARRYSWFTDTAPMDKLCPVRVEDLVKLLQILRRLTADKREAVKKEWPDSLPTTDEFRRMVADERKASEVEDKARQGGGGEFCEQLRTGALDALVGLQDAVLEMSRQLQKVRRLPYEWVEDAVRDVRAGNDGIWQELYKRTHELVRNVADVIQGVESSEVTFPAEWELSAVYEDVRALEEHIRKGGSWGFGPFRPKVVKHGRYIVKEARVNGRNPNDLEKLASLGTVLRIRLELKRAWKLWAGRAKELEGPYSLQMRYIEGLAQGTSEVLSLGVRIAECEGVLPGMGVMYHPEWHKDGELQGVLDACGCAIAMKRREQASAAIASVEAEVAKSACGAKVHNVTHELIDAIRMRNVEAFARCQQVIEQLACDKGAGERADRYLAAIAQRAPEFAGLVARDYENTVWDERVKVIGEAWRWAQARTWLEEFTQREDAPSLQERAKQLEDEIGRALARIAALRAWEFCFARMEEKHRREMEAWRQSMARLGKGTGKHAPRYRREAQQHLNACREAVPAWVMPLHRVWDTVDAAAGVFDVIVVDEASQCGFEALPLMYLGKKILVVGDDKQISPDAVGLPLDAVHRLMEEFLHDFRLKDSFAVGASLFDHGKLRWGARRITLVEHFRCMPEIIRFSNRLCYKDTPLIPLRQYGANRLEPLKRVYVPTGNREGSTANAINRPEAREVVNEIVKLCENPELVNKTLGVVVLQGDAQARLIEEELLQRLGAEEMERRKLRCGNPYSFQGDERDIMFLSMVAATNERIGVLGKSSDEQRFNVAASRARDQMWLFHSVERNDLSTSCLRRQLLEFFEETRSETVAGIDVGVLERKAREANRNIIRPPEPFDSWFEVDVALELARKRYQVTPQFKVADKRIDLVVEGGQSRLAVECDGDEFHGLEAYDEDMQRQRMLERCGWTFFRVRAAAFYTDREKALGRLWRLLSERGIDPLGLGVQPVDAGFVGAEEVERAAETPAGVSTLETVEVGDVVVYVDQEDADMECRIQISHGVTNPDWGVVNEFAPIAHALLGCELNEVVEVRLPAGVRRLCIREIRKASV
jgi:very-short-patch-repair endonuclease